MLTSKEGKPRGFFQPDTISAQGQLILVCSDQLTYYVASLWKAVSMYICQSVRTHLHLYSWSWSFSICNIQFMWSITSSLCKTQKNRTTG